MSRRASQPLLSVCMIARDEAGGIREAIASVQGVADQVVVVDTGSADETPRVAQAAGAEVAFFPWADDFSAARNASLAKARGRWILVLDADERLDPADRLALRRLVEAEEGAKEGYFLQLLDHADDPPGPEVARFPVFRLFRNRPEYRFKGRIHEQILWAVLARAPQGSVGFAPVRLHHFGYRAEVVAARRKVERNLRLLQQELAERPGDPFLLYNLGVEWTRAGFLEKALAAFDEAATALPWTASYRPLLEKRRALLLRELGQTSRALQVIDEALVQYPDYTDLRYLRGHLLWDRRQYPEALAEFRACVATGDAPERYAAEPGTGSYLAWYSLGCLHHALGDHQLAERAYVEAAQRCPSLVDALRRLVRLWLSRCSWQEVLARIEERLGWTAPALRLLVARTLCEEGALPAAKQVLEGIASVPGKEDALQYWRGTVLWRMGRFQEGLRLLQGVPPESRLYEAALLECYRCACTRCDWTAGERALRELATRGRGPAPQVHAAVRQLVEGEVEEGGDEPSPRAHGDAPPDGAVADLLGLIEVWAALGERRLLERALRLVLRVDGWVHLREIMELLARYRQWELLQWLAVQAATASQVGQQVTPSAQALVALARHAEELGAVDQALASLHWALRDSPGWGEVYLELARLRCQQAVAALAQGLKRFPGAIYLQRALDSLSRPDPSR